MNSIKLIKQTDDTGCGIACVAMVANCDYELAKTKLMTILKWKNPNRNFYTRAKQLNSLLISLNVKSNLKKSINFFNIL